MPTPDRKKSKHKKKEKDSSHRSSSKHKSKKKKTSRSPSRNREKKRENKKEVRESPLNMNLGGFGFDIFKKLQELKDGKKPDDMSNFGFWPYLKPPISVNDNGANDLKLQKEKKNSIKPRLLIPMNYDSLMIILEDPFYLEYLSDEMIRYIKKKLIQSMKKNSAEQKQEQFLSKIHKLEVDLKKSVQVEVQEPQIQLGQIESIFAILNNVENKECLLDKEIKDILDPIEIETICPVENEIFEEAKQMFT